MADLINSWLPYKEPSREEDPVLQLAELDRIHVLP